jgi:hypothetical protein
VQHPIPTHPTDPASTSLRDPLAGNESHLTPLVNAGLGVDEPEPVGWVRADALDALAYGQALCDPLTAMRWVTLADALAYGALVSHVAAALGPKIAEVTTGLRSWADDRPFITNPVSSTRNTRAVLAPLREGVVSRSGGVVALDASRGRPRWHRR